MNGMLTVNLTLAIKAALLGGEAIMKVYEGEINVELKDDKSPLTQADMNANEQIMNVLRDSDIPIISEENKEIDFETRQNWQECWIVDPLDGTKEFIKRNGEFTVNIALAEAGVPTLGVIYVPVTKELYYADVKKGIAFKTVVDNLNQSPETLVRTAKALKPRSNSSSTLDIVGSRSHMNDETLSYVEQLKGSGKQVNIVSKGSSLKFCLIAEGKADIYPRFAPTMEWDTAAGQAICNAVGIAVISKETDQQLQYNKENLLNPWFLVSK